MKSGRVNSKVALENADRVFQASGGSWVEVERVSRREPNGVHVVRASDLSRDQHTGRFELRR
jgi:hypothetical protein